jgi:hypothetical protein
MNAWLRYLLRYPLEVKAPLVQPGNVPLARQSFGEAYATVPLPDDDSQFTSADKSTAYDHFVYGGLAAMAALGIGITAYALTAPTTLHDLTDITVGEYLRASFAEQAAFLDRMAPIAQALLPPQSTENCVICLSNPATIKTNPCGHVVMCQVSLGDMAFLSLRDVIWRISTRRLAL